MRKIAWLLAGVLAGPASAEYVGKGALLATHSVLGHVPVKTWKSLRDDLIVKQSVDYSCGAASLATVLSAYYAQAATEEALLKAMDKGEGRASFEDMARALSHLGFRAQGFAASWDQLTRLKMPVVVYIRHRGNDHFSVLRGINARAVWLADPSLGNRTYGREQFLAMWETRSDQDDFQLAGKFLAILPIREHTPVRHDFFTRSPLRQSALATAQVAFRPR